MLGVVVVVCGLILWFAPFVVTKHGSANLTVRDKRARWGLLLEVIAIGLVLNSPFWRANAITWRLMAGALLLTVAAALSWSAVRALGRQLRIDAAIGVEHELIQTGPYRFMRHPIYCSMLALVLGIGIIAAPCWQILIAIALCIIGTEVRVQIEDRLLRERFGESFERYRSSTAAYLPLVR